MKTSKIRLMELAGLSIKENTATNVIAAIAKNKVALTAAISKRLKNPEDTSAYEAVESLIVKTAIDAGVPKKYAEDVPWMETYAVPEESTAKDDLKRLEEDLIDMIENPEPEMTAATPANTKKIDSAQITSTFEKAASQGVYLLGKTAFSRVFSSLMNARPKDTRLEGSNEFRWLYSSTPIIVKDGSNVYLLFLELEQESAGGVVMIVQVKNDKFIQDVYVAKSPNTNQYTDPRSGTKEAINLKDRLVAKVAQAGIADKEKREMLGDQPSLNPALNGKIKVPECSKIQSQLSTVSESLHEQLLRAAKNKLQ